MKNCYKLGIIYCCGNMNSNINEWDSTKQAKTPYFHCGSSTKIRREIEKNRKIYSKYKNIKVLKMA